MATFKGNPPTGDGWKTLKDFGEWTIYIQKKNNSDEWVTLKVCANGRIKKKANYWLSKNLKTGQIGFSRDYALMSENRPSLFAMTKAEIDELAIT